MYNEIGSDAMRNKNKWIIFGILCVFFFALFIFTFYNSFLYSAPMMKITKIKEVEKSYTTNGLGLQEEHLELKITGVLLNGKNKGKEEVVSYEETFSSVVTEKYEVGDIVFIKDHSIDGLKRDTYVVFLVMILVLLLFLVGSFRGLLAIGSVIFNVVLFCFGLHLYLKGVNLLLLCLLFSIIFTILSLVLTNGIHKKTFVAIGSVIVSMSVLFLLSFGVVKITGYRGINFNEISFLTVPLEDVILAELMIGGLGAIMDVSITMSASISELLEKNKKMSISSLLHSGREIGKDIMSTMIGVLFFTYLCSGLPVFVLALRNGFSFFNYISTNFSLELSRFLVGSIGILVTIPISLFLAIFIFKKGEIQ